MVRTTKGLVADVMVRLSKEIPGRFQSLSSAVDAHTTLVGGSTAAGALHSETISFMDHVENYHTLQRVYARMAGAEEEDENDVR